MLEAHVTCRICGHVAETLARHLKAAHGVTADDYRLRFPNARIRSEQCETNRKAAAQKRAVEQPTRGKTKVVNCSECGTPRTVGWSFAPATHETRCEACCKKAKDAKWAGLAEGLDYVRCLGCSYRAENLTSHVQSAHPEWVGNYPGKMIADRSAIRDKTALQGRTHTPETIAKMKASAGWNRGLTKETDERVARAAEAMKGRSSWSKGLTKADHPGLQSTSEKLSALKCGVPNDGARLDLAAVDFTPYLDETGTVDRRTMAEELGISEPTVTKYMEVLGLRLSTKYVDARVAQDIATGRFYEMSRKSAEETTIRLTAEQLQPYRLGVNHEGKLVVAKAMVGLGHAYLVIKRESARLGIPTFAWLVRQTICLEAVSKALGGVSYEQEWRSRKFMTPEGNFYRYDGFFQALDLVVEFHGYQHWTFPSVYIKRGDLYFALQERDRIKENLILADPVLRYFLVREDEPYGDPAYLRGRLIDEGVLNPPR